MTNDNKGYYKTLGLSPSATDKEIRDAYLRLCRKYHPDAHSTDKKEAEKKFCEVAEAYEVLKDSQKRQQYDSGGARGFDFSGFGGGYEKVDPNEWFGGGMGDLFEQFFGGGRKSSRANSYAQQPTDIELISTTQISLENAHKGIQIHERIARLIKCAPCDGRGSGASPCSSCGGKGAHQFSQGYYVVSQACGTCLGTGKVNCSTCKGRGAVREDTTITVDVPAGIKDGTRLRVKGKGNFGAGRYGDLIIVLRVKQHEIFKVLDSGDIALNIVIPLHIAVLGGVIRIPCVNSSALMLTVPAGSQNGQEFQLSGKGMTSRNNMKVIIQIEIPEHLSLDQSESMKKINWNDANFARSQKVREKLHRYL